MSKTDKRENIIMVRYDDMLACAQRSQLYLGC